ncbi:MAG: hypothetical protein WCL29_05610, partial [Pseudomonadota bacterium]
MFRILIPLSASIFISNNSSADVATTPSSNILTYFFFALCGFRLVMRPLSVPAVSSMTALM